MRKQVLAAALLHVFLTGPALAHGEASWIMANPATRHCCGPQDCRPLDEREVSHRADGWYVNGYKVPEAAIYPTEDRTARYWGCFVLPALIEPRCLFLPVGF